MLAQRDNIRTLLIIVLSLILLLLGGCWDEKSSYFNGYIEGQYTYISVPVSGKLISLNVHRGQAVTQNTLLYTLEATPENFALKNQKASLASSKFTGANLIKQTNNSAEQAEIQAQLAQAKANLTYYQTQLGRNQMLYNKKQLSQSDLDASIQQVNIYQGQVQQYDASLAAGRHSLGREYSIKAQMALIKANQALVNKAKWTLAQKQEFSPLSGTVFNTFYRVGEQVQSYQPVVSLLAPGHIKVIFFVPEPKLSKIKLGQTLYLTCDGCQKVVKATISYITPQAEYTPPVIYSEKSRSKLVYRVKGRFNQQQPLKLKPGQLVDVYLTPPKASTDL